MLALFEKKSQINLKHARKQRPKCTIISNICLCLRKKGFPGVFVYIKHEFKHRTTVKRNHDNITKIKIKDQMRHYEIR